METNIDHRFEKSSIQGTANPRGVDQKGPKLDILNLAILLISLCSRSLPSIILLQVEEVEKVS